MSSSTPSSILLAATLSRMLWLMRHRVAEQSTCKDDAVRSFHRRGSVNPINCIHCCRTGPIVHTYNSCCHCPACFLIGIWCCPRFAQIVILVATCSVVTIATVLSSMSMPVVPVMQIWHVVASRSVLKALPRWELYDRVRHLGTPCNIVRTA